MIKFVNIVDDSVFYAKPGTIQFRVLENDKDYEIAKGMQDPYYEIAKGMQDPYYEIAKGTPETPEVPEEIEEIEDEKPTKKKAAK